MFLCKTCGMLLDNDSAYCPVCDTPFITIRPLHNKSKNRTKNLVCHAGVDRVKK